MPTERERSRMAAPISAGVPRRILKARQKRAEQKMVRIVREAVVFRADGRCEICGVPCVETGEAHHKDLRSRGGKWTMANILFLCRKCHGKQHGVNR